MAAFEDNKAETATMLPVINAFKSAHQLRDVTLVADAGMISHANRSPCKLTGCPTSGVRASRTYRIRCANGVTSTPMRRFLTGWY